MNIELKLSADLQEAHILVKGLEAMFKAGNIEPEGIQVSAPKKAQSVSVTAKATPITPTASAPTAVPTAAPECNYTLAELQAACAPLMDSGKTKELQALLVKYNVTSFVRLPKERYGELATDLRALGARI